MTEVLVPQSHRREKLKLDVSIIVTVVHLTKLSITHIARNDFILVNNKFEGM
jgi:hypothetical protein